MAGEMVQIHYHRPPDRMDLFEQAIVEERDEYVVTFMPSAGVRRPVIADGQTILEPGAPVVWFTYPGIWHDIGRFHLRDGRFTGCYANVLTPVVMEENRWETTDLFLDVWVPVDGEPMLLDEEELADAERMGWVAAETADRAREHARGLLDEARGGRWPPAHVAEWTLERVLQRLRQSG